MTRKRFRARALVAALAILPLCAPWAAVRAAPLDPGGDYVLGDWAGTRTDLARQGVRFDLGYVGEMAHNLSGGFREDGRLAYADQFHASLSLDLERLAGVNDADFKITLTNRNGENLTGERLVDPATGGVSSVQEVFGRGNVTRLTQLWFQQGLFGGALEYKLGRIPLSDDFATLESRFQNLYLGSGQPGNQAGAVWYNWPVSQWGGRVKVQDGARRYLQLGVFDQNPENLDPDQALDLYRHGSEGVITPVEVGWVPDKGPGGLPGKYKLGAYYSSAEATDYEDGGTRGRRYGGYFVVQQQVSAPHGDRRGLTLFSQGSLHDPDTAYVARYLSAGASWRGPWQGRPRDELGVGLAYAEIGDAYVDSATAGNPLVAGPGAAGYVPPQSDEWNAELYYGIHMTPWLTLRPNLQYLAHPGANDAVDDAWVVGTTVALTL